MKRLALLLVFGLAACQATDEISAPAAGGSAHLDADAGYQAIDISTGMPGRSSAPHAVNSSGVVLGIDLTAAGLYFAWSPSEGLTYPTTESGDAFYPDAINDRGDILGEAPLGGGLRMHWADGSWQAIPVPAGFEWVAGQTINSRGHIAGVYSESGTGNFVAFMWSAESGFTPIASLCEIVPFGMNASDQVVGRMRETCTSEPSVFSWTPEGGLRNLGTFGGSSAIATAVNAHGVIAVTITWPDNHATGVLVSPSLAVTTLPNPIGGVTTRVVDVNDRGEAVGSVQGMTGPLRPVYWDASQHATVLASPLDNGSTSRISSNGIIAGQVRGDDRLTHAWVWMPTAPADVTAPVIAYTGNAGTYTVDQSIAITCTASDAGSGLASSTCADIAGPAWSFAIGENHFSATAADVAGNTATASVSFTVVADANGLSSLVEQWVSNGGVANSLVVKLSHGSYEAFRHEVAAQSGKKIPADKAAALLRLAAGL
jgi:uncharacterized membrane protein